ncbi:MAG: hypothetical protein ACNI25_16775 [Halarcobacter sp.]
MQILFLVEDKENLWEESRIKLEPLLKYNKSLSQNILLSDCAYISNGFSSKCLVVNTNEMKKLVMLSPSLIVNLYNKKSQLDIEAYFRVKWPSAQIVCWNKKYLDKRYFDNFIDEKDIIESIAYTTNLEAPKFKLLSKTVKDEDFIGLIEQAVTEYFSDRNFYKSFKLLQTSKILKNRSIIFKFQYKIIKENADYTIKINSVSLLSFFDLVELDINYVYEYFDEVLDFRYKYYIEQVKLRQYIDDLCKKHNINLEPSIFRTFVLSKDDKLGLHRPYFGGVNDLEGIKTINDKHLTNVILKEKGFKTNISYEYSLDELNNEKVIEEIPLEYPLVLKPTDKKKGYGVVTNILNPEKMLFSVKELMKLGDIKPVLIEEFFVGMTYRVLVVAEEVIAVLKFMPTYIVGNGKLTIKELILSKNILLRSRIRINDALELNLLNDGYNYSTILENGHKYILSHNSHASMGGQATNVTDIFSDELKQISCEVTKSLGLTHTGIDMNVNAQGDYRILEVNCAPALSSHLYPKYGTSIDTYSKVLEAFFTHTDLQRVENKYLPEMFKYHK